MKPITSNVKSAASRIRMARRAKGLTQADLAAEISVSRSAVAQWERSDGSSPSATNLEKLAVALVCSFEWLATGRGNRISVGRNVDSDAAEAVALTHFARDDAEENVLSVFRELDLWDQRALLSIADTLSLRKSQVRRKPAKA